jgi:hypothetical protein
MADFLPIFEMDERHPGLTEHIAGGYCQAAYVTLDRHHSPPADFTVRFSGLEERVPVRWPGVTERWRRAWNNQPDRTEAGAYAMAIAAVELLEGLVAIGRAEQGTGADYYLGKPDVEYDDFESAIRLEVTGTESSSVAEVARALRVKVVQLGAGNSNLPGRACAVGYRVGLILSEVFEKGGMEVFAR